MTKLLFILGCEAGPPDHPRYEAVCHGVEWPSLPRAGELIVLSMYTEAVSAAVKRIRWQWGGSVHVLLDAKLTFHDAAAMVEHQGWAWSAFDPTGSSPRCLSK